MSQRDLVALGSLTASLTSRLLREGLVMRSLIWPTGLTAGTLFATLLVLVMLQTPSSLAVSTDLAPELEQAMLDEGWTVARVADPAAMVFEGDAWAGTDGQTLWLRGGGNSAARLEGLLRERRGARWRPTGQVELPMAADTKASGSLLVRMLLLLFTLYGVVFGLGMVARDRDDGTLDAELSLPISGWVPGAARWLAGTLVLTAFLAYAVAIFDGILGVESPAALVRHGFAASGGAVGLGIAVIGGAGLKQGFSGPLAFALTGAAGMLGLGGALPEIGRWLPIGSVLAGGDGWAPAIGALGCGLLAAVGFAFRAARS